MSHSMCYQYIWIHLMCSFFLFYSILLFYTFPAQTMANIKNALGWIILPSCRTKQVSLVYLHAWHRLACIFPLERIRYIGGQQRRLVSTKKISVQQQRRLVLVQWFGWAFFLLYGCTTSSYLLWLITMTHHYELVPAMTHHYDSSLRARTY